MNKSILFVAALIAASSACAHVVEPAAQPDKTPVNRSIQV